MINSNNAGSGGTTSSSLRKPLKDFALSSFSSSSVAGLRSSSPALLYYPRTCDEEKHQATNDIFGKDDEEVAVADGKVPPPEDGMNKVEIHQGGEREMKADAGVRRSRSSSSTLFLRKKIILPLTPVARRSSSRTPNSRSISVPLITSTATQKNRKLLAGGSDRQITSHTCISPLKAEQDEQGARQGAARSLTRLLSLKMSMSSKKMLTISKKRSSSDTALGVSIKILAFENKEKLEKFRSLEAGEGFLAFFSYKDRAEI